ncbi:M1 family metallopeptidase [Paenibacillus assamensis]|uniref:M1 family metallopeptidase n=1 Tax=Paenibacillus assamensis TaxID=311244 RepID=UPI000428811D|nr:M1 family metallopeptidase [Paenibacillus assamensis]
MTRVHAYRSTLYAIVLMTTGFCLLLWLLPNELVPSVGPEAIEQITRKEGNTVTPPPPIDTPRSERVAEYHIDVKLDEASKTLRGLQAVTWSNPGRKTVNELYFHLYPNAFESADTTFMKESGGKLRGDKMPTNGYGNMRLTAIQTEDGLPLMNRLEYVQPDDGNAKDRTVMKLRLPQPVKAGESITLKMKYEVKLPSIFARMGATDNFVMAGQWFPKLAAYEKAGTRGRNTDGWNVHQYHGNSEFYSNYGIFNVRIQVPETYIVAATGFPTKTPMTTNSNKVYHFYADDVHDFAWAASPNFIYVEEPFSSKNVPGVRIKLYLDPKHKALKERYMYAAKAALNQFSQWYGEYPYSTLSIVVPPLEANGAGGMEYPTLVTTFGAGDDSPGYDLERTVVHEIGHQYFYGLLASNEFEEAWLDEGFTSYAEDKLMESEFGITPNFMVESSYITSPAPLKQSAWQYHNQEHYAENVYVRAKLVLVALERQVGEKTMKRILKTYTEKYRFKHPTTADFQRVVESVTKQNWSSFFNQYVYDRQMADFAVESIELNKTGNQYESIVHITKRGADYPEVPIVFRFEDGSTTRKIWSGEGDRIQYKLTHSSPLSWVFVDPLHTIVLDNKQINNFMKASVTEPVRTRVDWTAMKWIEMMSKLLGW